MEIKKLIEQIQASGMRQAQISRDTGIPQARLSRWAAGKAPDAAADGIKLAKLAAKIARRNAKVS
jgi:predicted XRE-type DNA-binding protein